jgi:hypothetical protein
MMRTLEEVERLLLEDLNNARVAHEIAQKALASKPSRRLHINSGEASVSTLAIWKKALREFSAFVLHGTVPDRFKGGRKNQPDPLSSMTGSRIESHQDFRLGVPTGIRFRT